MVPAILNLAKFDHLPSFANVRLIPRKAIRVYCCKLFGIVPYLTSYGLLTFLDMGHNRRDSVVWIVHI